METTIILEGQALEIQNDFTRDTAKQFVSDAKEGCIPIDGVDDPTKAEYGIYTYEGLIRVMIAYGEAAKRILRGFGVIIP